jgi:uncharacterized protein (DUF1778 family)
MSPQSTATPTTKTRTRAVNLRVRKDICNLIDRAAQTQGKSRSEFMIDAACQAAEDALLNHTLLRVDAQTYAHFLSVLDQPTSIEGYARLMSAKRPWRPECEPDHFVKSIGAFSQAKNL